MLHYLKGGRLVIFFSRRKIAYVVKSSSWSCFQILYKELSFSLHLLQYNSSPRALKFRIHHLVLWGEVIWLMKLLCHHESRTSYHFIFKTPQVKDSIPRNRRKLIFRWTISFCNFILLDSIFLLSPHRKGDPRRRR